MKLFIKCENDVKQHYIERVENPSSYEDDSGFDLFIPNDITVPKGAKGFKIKHHISCMPSEKHGYYLYPRSSISKGKLRLSNSVGIIDCSYRGDIMAAVDNIGDCDYVLGKGTRSFQLCSPDLKPINVEMVDELPESYRGDGGFGSSGQ